MSPGAAALGLRTEGMAHPHSGGAMHDREELLQKFIFSFAPAQRGGPNTWMVYLP
jgi:hypothetical protein